MNVFSNIRKEVIKYFSNTKESHDWQHTERVYNLCMIIGKKENADLEILKYAAILHDIGREYQDKSNGKMYLLDMLTFDISFLLFDFMEF